jgi:hypothetical protein
MRARTHTVEQLILVDKIWHSLNYRSLSFCIKGNICSDNVGTQVLLPLFLKTSPRVCKQHEGYVCFCVPSSRVIRRAQSFMLKISALYMQRGFKLLQGQVLSLIRSNILGYHLKISPLLISFYLRQSPSSLTASSSWITGCSTTVSMQCLVLKVICHFEGYFCVVDH